MEGARTPEFIGPYEILAQLGEGAMGVVFAAEQHEPVRRRVAIKLLKFADSSREVVARFDLERQALAIMDHPCIAKVFDAGVTDKGEPFFAMEYVDGEPVTEFAAAHRLSLEERIQLFQRICYGVHHAHQKGVIHRDLKPGNVLAVRHDGQDHAKVIDFGLARATNRRLGAIPLQTEPGQFLGTPSYMAPEQAAGRVQDVDARSDIYSLGVMLYELLCGMRPFDDQELLGAGHLEMQRVLAEVEPKPPSVRLAQTVGVDSQHAGRLRLSASNLKGRLRGDLDWITMKALSKEPQRRYASAHALAEDLGRHLREEAVAAGPPSLTYHFRKFLRRRRVEAIAAVALVSVAAVALYFVGDAVVAEANAKQRFENLLVGARVEAVAERARLAVPAWPRNATELQELVGESEQLVESIPSIEAVMSEIADGCRVVDAAERAQVRGAHPESQRRDRLAEVLGWIDYDLSHPAATREEHRLGGSMAEHTKAELAACDARIRASNSIEIDDPENRMLYDRLEAQVVDLRDLEHRLLPDLRQRLAWAERLQREQDNSIADGWEFVGRRVREDERFAGLDLKPQFGLRPIGTDPTTGLEEFLHLASHRGDPSAVGTAGNLVCDENTGLVLVLIPPGDLAFRNELMQIDPILVSKFELNRTQWQRLAADSPGLRLYEDAISDLRNLCGTQLLKPANGVTWNQCRELLRRYALELPTEPQWEYACNAGGNSVWHCGDDAESVPRFANIRGVSSTGEGDVYRAAAPVFAMAPNDFGLHQMHGNVAEWCSDFSGGDSKFRGFRGGAWDDDARSCRSRGHPYMYTLPGDAAKSVGVRPVRAVYGSDGRQQ